ncbi:MAG: hypothetical protein RI955_868 [Bacteroidota bacterium]
MILYKIRWTKKAIKQLDKISEYYFEYSVTAAQSIVSNIFKKVVV